MYVCDRHFSRQLMVRCLVQITVKLVYKDHPIGTNKMWSLYTGGLYKYMQIQ